MGSPEVWGAGVLPTLRWAQAGKGMAQARTGMAQAGVGMAQARVGMAQARTGMAQAGVGMRPGASPRGRTDLP